MSSIVETCRRDRRFAGSEDGPPFLVAWYAAVRGAPFLKTVSITHITILGNMLSRSQVRYVKHASQSIKETGLHAWDSFKFQLTQTFLALSMDREQETTENKFHVCICRLQQVSISSNNDFLEPYLVPNFTTSLLHFQPSPHHRHPSPH